MCIHVAKLGDLVRLLIIFHHILVYGKFWEKTGNLYVYALSMRAIVACSRTTLPNSCSNIKFECLLTLGLSHIENLFTLTASLGGA